MITLFYFFSIFLSVPLAFLFVPSLTFHGHINKGTTKNFFILFYAQGLLVYAYFGVYNLYTLHLLRRFIECLIFKYERSKMTLLQFINGIVYYTVVVIHLKNRVFRHTTLFFVLSFSQSISHLMVFKLKKRTFYHYYLEILIYLYIFCETNTPEMFFNFLYVFSFSVTCIINRNRINKTRTT